jgi:hypothetical protein
MNPAIYGKFFSIADSLNEFPASFSFLGSSPRMFYDYSWYKDIDFNPRKAILEQYAQKRHMLLLTGTLETIRSAKDNSLLAQNVQRMRIFAGKVENNLNSANIKRIIKYLEQVCCLVKGIDRRIPQAIEQGIGLLSEKNLNAEKITRAGRLTEAFGRGQQYISLVRKFIP